MSAMVEMVHDGATYRLIRLKPTQAILAAARVARALASAGEDIGTLASLAGGASQDQLVSAISKLIASVDGEALVNEGVAACVGRLHHPGGKVATAADFDDYFAERIDHMLPVLIWALKENLAGFFVKPARS